MVTILQRINNIGVPKYNKICKILTERNVSFMKNEHYIYIHLKSLIVNVFINNDIEAIDRMIKTVNLHKFSMKMFALAARYSNINTIYYFNSKNIREFDTFVLGNMLGKIIYFAVERTDDNVEILDAVYQERKLSNYSDLYNTLDIAINCGNNKMANYLRNEIAIIN
jgi:hypothetical protein